MGGFGEGPAHPQEVEDADAAAARSRLGLKLFAVYLALYAAFMGLSAFAPELMKRPALGGVNLAITFGFGLIVAALLLAFLYGWLCRVVAPPERKVGP